MLTGIKAGLVICGFDGFHSKPLCRRNLRFRKTTFPNNGTI
jgi:hypothetical protein